CVPARVGGIERVYKWTYVGRYSAARKRRWNAGWISKHCCSQAVKFGEETIAEDINLIDVITTQKSYAVVPDVIHFDHRVPSDFEWIPREPCRWTKVSPIVVKQFSGYPLNGVRGCRAQTNWYARSENSAAFSGVRRRPRLPPHAQVKS